MGTLRRHIATISGGTGEAEMSKSMLAEFLWIFFGHPCGADGQGTDVSPSESRRVCLHRKLLPHPIY